MPYPLRPLRRPVPFASRVLSLVLSTPLSILGGCGPTYSPDTYAGRAVQQAAKVEQGVVAGVREVVVAPDGTVGGVTGSAAGGIAGSQTPGGVVGAAFGALSGTLVGGLVGNTVERASGTVRAYEYIVRKPDGELVSVAQADAVPLPLGQKVLVITGAQARVVPDYTVAQQPPAPPKPREAALGPAPAPPEVPPEP